ncbi:hypothetical protein GTZ99_10885 [Novosphingobium sp. FSY-8]|uniref:Transmembrane protein n=1 Tax=Novosphingobium ovatum TaxID=1908523 RepID=A0ABW9XEW5_9SPHN|nr:hypothetical protein [Novosphingobium ovatum]
MDWRHRMSDHIAYALLVYTGLQIFVTIGALRAEGPSLLPYLALVILVAGIIPACRGFERRWQDMGQAQDDAQAHATLATRFRRDCLMLWAMAIGLPFVITGLFALLNLLFG